MGKKSVKTFFKQKDKEKFVIFFAESETGTGAFCCLQSHWKSEIWEWATDCIRSSRRAYFLRNPKWTKAQSTRNPHPFLLWNGNLPFLANFRLKLWSPKNGNKVQSTLSPKIWMMRIYFKLCICFAKIFIFGRMNSFHCWTTFFLFSFILLQAVLQFSNLQIKVSNVLNFQI